MNPDARSEGIIRDILDRVDDDAGINQRDLARDLGIALGMTNAYVKRCVRKGWIKVNQVPARRYRYYLTPKGFTEKSRLTAEYFSDSLKFFRRARQSLEQLYAEIEARGDRRVILCGADELTEIAALCAPSQDFHVLGVLRGDRRRDGVGGLPAPDPKALPPVDCLVIAATDRAEALYARARDLVGPEKVAVPDVLDRILNHRP